MAEPFDALECLEDMKTPRMVVGDPEEYLEDYHAKIDKIIAAIAADRKRIEELGGIIKMSGMDKELYGGHVVDPVVAEANRLFSEQVADQAATIERLRGALEPFAPSYDIIDNDCYGIFLGGLIKRNFVDARQALGKEE